MREGQEAPLTFTASKTLALLLIADIFFPQKLFCRRLYVIQLVITSFICEHMQINRHSLTINPRYGAPTFNIIPPIELINFCPKKCFNSYLHISNNANLGIEHSFDQSFEIRYSKVKLYILIKKLWGLGDSIHAMIF